MEYGGRIERGRVTEVTDAGYVVESLDRKGIVSPPIPTMSQTAHVEDDRVLFVLFADGTGMILTTAQII